MSIMIEILRYRREDGREPFTEWLSAIRDKRSQAKDIKRAKELWLEWRRRQT